MQSSAGALPPPLEGWGEAKSGGAGNPEDPTTTTPPGLPGGLRAAQPRRLPPPRSRRGCGVGERTGSPPQPPAGSPAKGGFLRDLPPSLPPATLEAWGAGSARGRLWSGMATAGRPGEEPLAGRRARGCPGLQPRRARPARRGPRRLPVAWIPTDRPRFQRPGPAPFPPPGSPSTPTHTPARPPLSCHHLTERRAGPGCSATTTITTTVHVPVCVA